MLEPPADDNLWAEACALHQRGHLTEAEAAYRRVLSHQPDNADCLRNLGAVLVQQHGSGSYHEAKKLVLRAIQLRPRDGRLRHTLGVIEESAGHLGPAVDAYERSIEKDPSNVKAHMDLASVLKTLGRHGRAVEVYRAVTTVQPDHPVANYKLASALKRVGRNAAAAEAYRAHLRVCPGHALSQFWLAALTGEAAAMKAMPADMVAGLFDQYADKFDEHLVQALHYRTPEMLRDLLVSAAQASTSSDQPIGRAPVRWRRCCDLGCGTGLMGPLLRPLVETYLEGVDLSERMVHRARERGCYDACYVAELVDHLNAAQGQGQTYDLLVAADVFVYVGDLAPVLHAGAAVTQQGGVVN